MTERIDLTAIRGRRALAKAATLAKAAATPATRGDVAAARSASGPLTRVQPEGGLPALGAVPAVALPPVKVAHRHQPELGDRLAVVEQARRVAREKALAWLQTMPNGTTFLAAVEEERAAVDRYLEKGEPIPDRPGPLMELLAAGQNAALAAAWHAQFTAEHAERRVREYGTTAKDSLGAVADQIETEIKSLFVRAAEERSRRLYEDARTLCTPWLEVAALHEWCHDPAKPYRPRRAGAIPASLAWQEQRAAEALELPRAVVDALGYPDTDRPEGDDSQPSGVLRRFLGR